MKVLSTNYTRIFACSYVNIKNKNINTDLTKITKSDSETAHKYNTYNYYYI